MKNKFNTSLGWNISKLGTLCTLQAGGTPSRTILSYWKDGRIKWISARHINEDKIQSWEYISHQGLDNSSAKVSNPGDLILVTRVSVGKVLFCEEHFAVNQDLTIIRKSSKINNKFLFFILKLLLNQLISSAQGLSIKGIERSALENLPIPCPPIEEQRRIVEVLECWDKGIALVKKLIEQKELQKKYLMQQLLSGVLRLKGFTQKWGKKPLGKLITLYQGYPFKSETYSAQGHYKIITIANVKQGYLDLAKFSTIQVLPPDILNYQQLDVGDILISMTGNVGRVCLVNSKNCLLNQRVGKIEANLLNKEFLFYILQLPDFLNVMLACAQGGAQANLSTKDIYHYVLFYPSDAREQQAIAEVLSSADKEIDLLKQKLAKLEAQKKGLMQVLLTGKIRLK